MARTYQKKTSRKTYRKSAYSFQQTVLSASVAGHTAAFTSGFYDLVASSTTQGKRTVANLRLKLLTNSATGEDSLSAPFGYTVQYVPSGYAP